jgi:hypothetical protein
MSMHSAPKTFDTLIGGLTAGSFKSLLEPPSSTGNASKIERSGQLHPRCWEKDGEGRDMTVAYNVQKEISAVI